MSVPEIRAGIASATQQWQSGVAATQQAVQQLEEGLQRFQQVTNGSDQPEVGQTNGQLAQAIQSLGEVQGIVLNAAASAETYSARL